MLCPLRESQATAELIMNRLTGMKIGIAGVVLSLSALFGVQASANSPAGCDSCVFTLPTVPASMTEVVQRAEYVAVHYWQGLDYSDTAWLADPLALEQVFVDWIPVVAQLPPDRLAIAAETVITHGNGYPAMQQRLGELSEIYFYEPDSPYRNEELYIPILHALMAAPAIGGIYKKRYQYQLDKAMKNSPGTQASDFTFITSEHMSQRLSDFRSDYVLLYFFNPDCSECRKTAAYISASPVFSALLEDKRLTVLAVYPFEDLQAWDRSIDEMPRGWIVAHYAGEDDRNSYHLLSIPSLYLLDREKNVILKDACVALIENRLRGEMYKSE